MCGIIVLLGLMSFSTHGHHRISAHIMDDVTLLFQAPTVPLYGVFLKMSGHDKYIYSCRDGRHVDASQQEWRPGGWAVKEDRDMCGGMSIGQVSVSLPNVTVQDSNTYEWWVQDVKGEAFKKFFTVTMIVRNRGETSDATATDARHAPVTDATPGSATYDDDDAAYEDASIDNHAAGDNAAEKIANAVAVILGVVVIVLLVILLRLCCSFHLTDQ